MFYLKQVPLFKVFLLLSIGIGLSDYSVFLVDQYVIMPIGGALALFLILALYLKKTILFNLSSILLLISIGILLHSFHDERKSKNHFYPLSDNKYIQCGGKIKTVSKTKSGIKIITSIDSIFEKNNSFQASGNLLVYTKINIDSFRYNVGDKIKLSGYISKIPKASNPFTFDPEKYYHYQNIHYQTFIKKDKLFHFRNNHNSNISNYFLKIKNSIKSRINKLIKDKINANIIISIMLGDKQDLDKEILTAFASTGTRHILTVSGMHVGIVALILNFIFSFYKTNNKIFSGFKIITILSGIWFYAFLTGAGPAIMRASFMISLIILGINLKRQINIFNILFASAVILLLINPFQLFQISFILSYTAMLSILIFFKPINGLLKLKKLKLLNYFWQLISLSIAAQILIFPLSLYYFHNAPLLFFITAIISTPMAFATIALGFIMVIVDFVSIILSGFISYILNIIIKFSLLIIRSIESVSFNIGEYIFLETIDIILIFTGIGLVTVFLKTNIRFYLVACILSLLTLFGNQFIRIYKANNIDQIVIYSNKNRIVDIFIDGKCFNYAIDSVSENNLNFTAKNYRIYRGINTVFKATSSQNSNQIILQNNILSLHKNNIVLLNSFDDLLPADLDTIDLLVIGGNLKFDLEPMLKKYKIPQIILEKGMKYKLRKHWTKIALEKKLKIWDINTNGAFIKQLN